MPLLSIIIPAYNAEAYLQRCLDSILGQNFSDFEVVCINDGSTDGTLSILESYGDNIKIISQPNCGMATARNRGLDMAQGKYVMFVDSDDSLCPNALVSLAPHLNGEDIIGFGTQVFNETTGIYTENPAISTATISGWDYFNRIRLIPRPVHFVCIWQRVYRRAFFEEHGLRFVDGLRRAEDDLFTTMAMLYARSVKVIPDCLYTYHVRPDSITRTDNPALRDDARRVQQQLAETFIPMQGIDKSAIYQVLASSYITHLSSRGNTLNPTEWKFFRQVCVTPRHRRLYRISRINPAFLRLYNRLCSSLR